MKRLSASPRYRSFSAKRDAALEVLLLKARAKNADKLRKFMSQVQGEVARAYPTLNQQDLDPYTYHNIKRLDSSIDRIAYSISLEMSLVWTAFRSQAFTLAHASEQQAVINAMGGTPKKLTKDDIVSAAYTPTEYGTVSDRSYLALSRLRRSIMDAVEMSRIMGDSPRDCMARMFKVFPQPQRNAKVIVLKRLKESSFGQDSENILQLTDFINEQEWEEMLAAYTEDFIPAFRDPRGGMLPEPVSVNGDSEFVTYPWQLEQEMTDDFMKSVRSGSNDGARAQGITDMVWVAVLGSHGKDHGDACQYCMKRDGLTTAEIEEKLKGPWSDDPESFKKSVTPLHPYCYCRLVPAADNLPEVPESNEASFEEWLNS